MKTHLDCVGSRKRWLSFEQHKFNNNISTYDKNRVFRRPHSLLGKGEKEPSNHFQDHKTRCQTIIWFNKLILWEQTLIVKKV